MTTTQAIAHQEQMEALRADFAHLWNGEEYRLQKAGLSSKSIFWAKQASWNIWREAFRQFKKTL